MYPGSWISWETKHKTKQNRTKNNCNRCNRALYFKQCEKKTAQTKEWKPFCPWLHLKFFCTYKEQSYNSASTSINCVKCFMRKNDVIYVTINVARISSIVIIIRTGSSRLQNVSFVHLLACESSAIIVYSVLYWADANCIWGKCTYFRLIFPA